jgi:hypothetical protein
LIVICGMPRSGTTWLGKVFDSHPATIYRHEPDSVWKLTLPLISDAKPTEDDTRTIEEFVRRLPSMISPRTAGRLPVFHKQHESAATFHLRRYSVFAGRLMERVLGEFHWPRLLQLRSASSQTLVWKSVVSLGRIGLFCHCLPQVRMIHIVRHPCGVVASRLRGERLGTMNLNLHSTRSLLSIPQAERFGITYEEFQKMDAVSQMAIQWVLRNEKAMDETEGMAQCQTHRYEDVCENPKDATQRLFDFCGLDFAEQTERFLDACTTSTTDRYYSVFRKTNDAVNKWRKELTDEQVARIESLVKGSRAGELYYS